MRKAIARATATASQVTDMGQTSSQLHDPAPTDPNMEDQPKSNRKKPKLPKSKRKSAEVKQPLDPEEESARALLQMRGGGVPNSTAPYYGNDLAASQQLIGESSPMRSPGLPNVEETRAESSVKRGSHREGDKSRKRKRSSRAIIDDPSCEQRNEEPRYPQLPSTPPDQADRLPPSSYRPNSPQSQHALDDVPTDEETAAFDEAFGNESAAAEPDLPNHDIFSFSQQPPDISHQQGEMFTSYQLPTNVYTSPRAVGNPKKRKRDTTLAMDNAGEEQLSVANEAGQYILEYDAGFFDDRFQVEPSSADPVHCCEGSEMPIDPELHSMSALPPSVDLSALENGDGNVRQAKKRKQKQSISSQPSKGRRTDEFQSPNEGHAPYYSPYILQDDQEDIQDQVPSGLEDYARRTSPELGTPFMENIARGGLEYLKSTSKAAQTLRHDKDPRQPKKTKRKHSMGNPATVNEINGKGYQSECSLKDVSGKGGAFSSTEIAKLDAFRDGYCDANNMNYAFFNSLIQTPMRGNADITTLFNQIHEVLPYRPRLSVQKFTRRRFHNYGARGTWNTEEDEELRRAVEEKGKQWKVVGEMIDRMPGDCRDRYRNYILNSEHRNREQWTEEEVRNLCRAILECMQLLKDERRQAREEKYGPDSLEHENISDQEVDDFKLINWQAVSDRMGEHGGARSRLQCNFKWSKLKKRDQTDLMNVVKEARGIKSKRSGPTKNPWRQKQASKKVANMKTGDQYTLLQSILGSNASTEGNIPWKSLSDEEFRATWTVADRKSAWLKMKESIQGSGAMDYREVINRLITRILAEGAGELDERWDPEVHGDVSQTKPRKSKKATGMEREGASTGPERRRSKRTREERRQAKSSEFVDEIDDEEEYSITNHFNPVNALPRSAPANKHADPNGEAASSIADDEEWNENASAENTNRDSLFEGTDDGSEYRPQKDGDISPETASRIQLLRFG